MRGLVGKVTYRMTNRCASNISTEDTSLKNTNCTRFAVVYLGQDIPGCLPSISLSGRLPRWYLFRKMAEGTDSHNLRCP
jgi:hypothetical protein